MFFFLTEMTYRSIAAGLLRTIWLCVAWPSGRMGWGFKPPPGSVEPVAMKIFNPTFWTMVEICLAIWAANLPPLAPLLSKLGFTEWVSTAYKKATSGGSNANDHSAVSRPKSMGVTTTPLPNEDARDSDVALVDVTHYSKLDVERN